MNKKRLSAYSNTFTNINLTTDSIRSTTKNCDKFVSGLYGYVAMAELNTARNDANL